MSDFRIVREPTFSERMRAIGVQKVLETKLPGVASAINHARYVDSFPHNYTPEALVASRELIIGAEEVLEKGYSDLADEVTNLISKGKWYA